CRPKKYSRYSSARRHHTLDIRTFWALNQQSRAVFRLPLSVSTQHRQSRHSPKYATYFFNNHPEVEKWLFKDTGSDQVSSDYPFLREEDAVDVLGPYLQKSTATPNLVLIIVEG